ncbi:Purine catabolism regulatory protein-like family protein [Streptomyces sp. 2224.1]|uniref:PucR family transcriptional regulator n=1 Tax=Streptomyces sp. 2224.1 TaxID=1881020 RepID=UPI0008946E2D|nr:PucR family transcriptional regulator [Streptomyces sp. 2224.1]SEC43236.1 Purine catabolism regulatory protein-like family protein [Streptomyces sp. 2224.1]
MPPRPLPPPSTPPVPLAQLLARTDLGLRQLAGPTEGVAIHWVHTSEMADPVPYLLGGEMLLTAGLHLAEVSREAGQESAAARDAYLDGYAARTVAAGAAALGFGIAPVHDTVPQALVAACDRHGLPLVEVQAGTPFTAVESAVWQAVTQARHRELTRLSEAQRALATAAARPDPATAVLRALARHVHGWTALLAPDGTEHGFAGPRPDAAVRTAAGRLAQVVGAGGPASATDTVPGGSLSAYALTGRARGSRALALVVAADPHDPPAHTIAGVAAVLLSLITGPSTDPAPATAGHAAALVRLLLGARPAEVAPLLGSPLWRVVHAERRRDTTQPAASLAAALGTPLVAPDSGSGPATTPEPPPDAGPGAAAAPCAAPALRALIPAGQEITAHPGWTLGVSEPVPVPELPAADRHAALALRRALAGRAALVRHRTPGPHSITSLVAPTEAQQHAQALLAPLTGSPALLSTLHNWLSLHGSWDRTATALGIHRNTVRQRITRIAGLLDTDLDDPDVRMELWFALRSLDRGAAPGAPG